MRIASSSSHGGRQRVCSDYKISNTRKTGWFAFGQISEGGINSLEFSTMIKMFGRKYWQELSSRISRTLLPNGEPTAFERLLSIAAAISAVIAAIWFDASF
jgi:hypothetical protein